MYKPTYPDRTEAERLLEWAGALNPGAWTAHSRMVAKATETIADHCGLDAEKAYVLGLLHDIGRYEGVRGLHHTIAGHDLMLEKGYPEVAKVCLTHSFPYPDMEAYLGGPNDCDAREYAVIEAAVHNDYDLYDNLVQLGDCLGSGDGIVLMDSRLLDVARRHGINEYSTRKWGAFISIKQEFDKLCKTNIYSFFMEDIVAAILRYEELQ